MIWIGVALLSTSWLFAVGYYYPVDWTSWSAAVAFGVLCLFRAPIEALPRQSSLLTACVLILPAVLLLPQPYCTAVALLFAGSALQLAIHHFRGLHPAALPQRASTAATLAGTVLLLQGVALRGYAALTSRNHELPAPLPKAIAAVAATLGFDSAQHENTISLHSMRQIHHLSATWELFLDPVTFGYLVGALGVFAWLAWNGPWDRKQVLLGIGILTLGTLLWLPLRSGLLMALYLHDGLRTDYDASLDAMQLFWNGWLQFALLTGPVAICWRLLPKARTHLASPIVPPSGTSWKSKPVLATMTLGLAAVLITFGLFSDPVGQRQAGRVLVEEYHPQPERIWEPTWKPYDTQWYGPDSGYNYYCIYDYLSHFYTMSRSTTPLSREMLAAHDVLVIKVPTRPYSREELSAIRDFVGDGGGLLLIGEHTNVFHTSDFLNPVARVFGFEFRDDCLFGIDSVFEQQYEPPLVPHPIVQHLEQMDFATSCSIDPGWSRGSAAIRDTGLKNLTADYHSDNFYPLPEDQPQMHYGSFVQLWSTRYGAGRVTAFTDSTIFSNFCTFDRGKAELMLGMVEWLNHRGSSIPYATLAVAAGILLLGGALAAVWKQRISWVVAVATCVLGSTVAIAATREMHRAAMPPPEPVRDFVQINIDRTVSDAPLSRNGFVNGTRDGFGIFERWLLRLGYFTSRRKAPRVFEGDAVVLLRPNLPANPAFQRELVRYVSAGGKVVVLDSAREDSTTTNLLQPFGLSVAHSLPLRGPLRTELISATVPVEQAVAVSGGQPFAWIGDKPVGSRVEFGQGSVILVGFADRFCDLRMGGTGDVIPDDSLQQVFDLHFSLLRWVVADDAERESASSPEG